MRLIRKLGVQFLREYTVVVAFQYFPISLFRVSTIPFFFLSFKRYPVLATRLYTPMCQRHTNTYIYIYSLRWPIRV